MQIEDSHRLALSDPPGAAAGLAQRVQLESGIDWPYGLLVEACVSRP